MKKWLQITLIILLTCLLVGILIVRVNKGTDTAIAALDQMGRHVDIVLHQEDVKNGVIVFYKTDVGEGYDYCADFVKKTLLGWKWVWGGGYGGSHELYFQDVDGTPFPMLYGDITDPETTTVTIKETTHNKSVDAQIVGPSDDRIWFVLLAPTDEPEFEIVSLTEEGAVLSRRSYSFTTSMFASSVTKEAG